MMTPLSDYIIPFEGLDVLELFDNWAWLVPSDGRPVLLTKFGDWFLTLPDGRLAFLDSLEATVVPLDDGTEEAIMSPGFFDMNKERLSTDWIDVCKARKLELETGQCYGWKVHPQIGGELAFFNIKIYSLRVYQSLTAQLLRQVTTGLQGRKITGFTLE
jgi:hypothetical protein